MCSAVAHAEDIVLFDAVTPATAVAGQSQGWFTLRDGLLEVQTKGNTGYPGVVINGAWDLSRCSRLTLELALLDTKGDLPLTVRLSNPDADPGKSEGVFIDRVKIHATAVTAYAVDLPPPMPYGREISRKLTGMKRSPLATTSAFPPARMLEDFLRYHELTR